MKDHSLVKLFIWPAYSQLIGRIVVIDVVGCITDSENYIDCQAHHFNHSKRVQTARVDDSLEKNRNKWKDKKRDLSLSNSKSNYRER